MGSRLRQYYQAHPPSNWVLLLEHAVRLLNALLVVAGLATLAYSLSCVYESSKQQAAEPLPWTVYASAAIGGVMVAAAGMAVLGSWVRSLQPCCC